jgi:hypothetical protein
MIQEAVYQTAGGTAETITGGVNMNLVPKDGGNRFAGALKYAKSPKQWQGDNLTSRLEGLGVSATDKIDNFYEFNIEQGGPIAKDKLWFFGAFRRAHYDKPIANTFNVPSSAASIPAGFAQCLAKTIQCDQGISDEKMDNPVVRMTWQMSSRNKFAAYMDRAMRLRGHAMGSLTDPATGSVVWHTPTFATGSAKWTSTVSSKLLFETGFSFNRERYDNVYQDGLDKPYGSAAWYAGARKSDNSSGLLWNASSAQLGNYPDKYNVMAAISYDRLSHNVKVGLQTPGDRIAVEYGEWRSLSDLQRRLAAAGDRPQHAAADGGLPRRESRRLRPGTRGGSTASRSTSGCATTTRVARVMASRRRPAASRTQWPTATSTCRTGPAGRRARRSSTTCPASARQRSSSGSTAMKRR